MNLSTVFTRSFIVSLFTLASLISDFAMSGEIEPQGFNVSPAHNETNVYLKKIVQLTLAKSYEGSFRLKLVKSSTAEAVAGKSVRKGQVLRFYTQDILEPNTRYSISLIDMQNDKETFISFFYTLSLSNALVSSSITNGESNVAINRNLALTLRKPYDAEKLTVKLAGTSEDIPIYIRHDGVQVYIEPKIPLSYDRTYTLRLIENTESEPEFLIANIAFSTTQKQEPKAYSYYPVVEPLGSEVFTLHPDEELSTHTSHRVTFGIPFPKGYLTTTEHLVIFDEYLQEKTIAIIDTINWLKEEENSSLRSVIVQMDVDFTNGDTQKVEDKKFHLVWGRSRTSEALQPLNVKDTWLQVKSHSNYGSAGIKEPNAYALFSPKWYGKSVIKHRLVPVGSYEDYSSIDVAMPVFGNTAINNVDPRVADSNLLDFDKTYSMWLFDRAMSLYQLALKTGKLAYFKEAHRATQFYASLINENGYFSLKPIDDMKYSYGESLVTNFILVGDPEHANTIEKMSNAWDSFNVEYHANTNFWTERHAAYKLLGYITAFELTGKTLYKEKAKNTFSVLKEMQNTPLVETAIKGALLHTAISHSEGGERFIASPWMSSLLISAVERMDIHIDDEDIPDFVIDMAGFFNQPGTSLYNWGGWAGTEQIFAPRYLAAIDAADASPDSNGFNDVEHALDVSKIFALAYFYTCQQGNCEDEFRVSVNKLLKTAETYVFPYWQREAAVNAGLSVFRLAPARKFNWWFNSSANIDFLMSGKRFSNQDGASIRVKQMVESERYYHVDDEIKVTYKIANLGTKKAKNVVLSARVPGFASNKVTFVSASNDGVMNSENIVWFLDEIDINEPEITLSYTIKINEYGALQSEGRRMSPLVFKAEVQYCNNDEDLSNCNPWLNVWNIGTHTKKGISNWDSVESVPPVTPSLIEISSPVHNGVISGVTDVIASVEDEQGVRLVELYINDNLYNQTNDAPYAFTFDADHLNAQTHNLKVIAYDHYGSRSEKSISVIPENPDTQAPLVIIDSPTEGGTYCNDISVRYYVDDETEIDSCMAILQDVAKILPDCESFVFEKNISVFDSIYNFKFEQLEENNLFSEINNVESSIGPYQQAAYFNGDAHLAIENRLNDYNNMTFSFWIKPSQDEGLIAQQAWNYIGVEYGWSLSLGPNNHLNNNSLALTWSSGDNIVNRNEANVVQSPPHILSLDEWQFVVLRKQGTLVDIFVDSEHVHQGQLASADIGFPLTADKRIKLAKPMVHETMYNRAFVGSVDNFAIWQRALTEQEIVDMYYNQASAGRHELTIKATDKAGNIGASTVDFNMAQCH